jgi:DNA-binding NtrC family response regulator
MECSAARVVTICEVPLYSWVTDGGFSSDLYYRLNIVTLMVSSHGAIRPTRDDIAHLAYELYEQRGRANGRDWDDWFQAETEFRPMLEAE